jgi:beta-glucanase (GH16 family)
MSYLRGLLAIVLTAALTPLLLTQSGYAATASSARSSVSQGGKITILPQISQRGDGAAAADAAKTVGEAKMRPAKPGRPVEIQRMQPGGAWETFTVRKEKDDGRVVFTPSKPNPVAPWTYRARALPYRGLSEAFSNSATDAWTERFVDEFKGSSLSPFWNTRGTKYDKGSQRKCSKAKASMAKVGRGVLNLKVAKDPNRRGDVCKWRNPNNGKIEKFNYFLNAHVGTQTGFSYRYGVAAARVKFQKPRGMHGSFWMNDNNEPFGSRSAEIDAVEFFGKGYNDGGLAQFIHYKGKKIGGLQTSATKVLKGKSDTWWSKYHVFSVEWDPTGYVFRIDGKKTYALSRAVTDKKVMVVLSLLSSDWELKNMPDSKSGKSKVDWVRVWQHSRWDGRNL